MSSQIEVAAAAGAYQPPSARRTSGENRVERADVADGARSTWNAFARGVAAATAAHGDVCGGGHIAAAPQQPTVALETVAAALLGAVAQASRGQSPMLRELTARADAHDLAALARRHFLDEVAEADTADGMEIVRLLRALDAVERALAEDAAQRLLGRLSGPEATQLVVEIAHDMRSPLGSILFLAEHLRSGRSGPLNPIQARQLGLIYSAALGLNGMTSDVMELARGGERLAAHAPIPFSVGEVIDGTLGIVRPMAEEKTLELAATIPDADFRLGHPAALGRVLLNLVTNALKFTTTGHVHVIVEPVDRTSLRFSVQDTGRGIPPHVLATLFDSFRRRQTQGYAFSSAGLGLAMCHKLVTAMGGELGVDTELEKGTRFHFELELPPASRM